MAMDSERASDTMRTSCKDSSSIIDLKIAGLDPLFKTCLKLTVKDIFQSQSLITHQAVGITGIFCFKNHLINRVEVMGVVVRVDRREKCNSYAIDDGTGVIGCTCWKNPSSALEPNVFFSSLPLSLQEKYDEILSCHISNTEEGYNLGDLILVRGRITVFRDMKEISVLDHRKIVNPNVELERLLRLPHLYAIYNKPFTPPTTVGKQLMMTSSDKHSVNELTLKYTIRQLLKNPIPVPCEITPQDLLTWPGIVSLLPPVQKGQRDTQELIRMVSSILQELEKTTGCVFQRNKADTFEVMCPDCPLADLVKQLLGEACQSGKNAEVGCHILHIEHQVRRCPQYSRIHTAVLAHLFECLETNSDVITVGPQRYIPVS